MKITQMRTNRMENPMGFFMDSIRLSYTVEQTESKRQTAAQIRIAQDESVSCVVWDSGKRDDIDSVCCEVDFTPAPRMRYFWQVQVWGDAGDTTVSDIAWFETPKAPDDAWQAQFITQSFLQSAHPVFVKTLHLPRAVRKARAYALGLGVYELFCNGAPAGDEVLLPGLHAYDSWLQYQTFALPLHEGENVLEAALGDGWYKGPYGLKASLPRHGDENAWIAEIHVEYDDGTQEVFGTDLSWQVRHGNVMRDTIYDGEIYDARVGDCVLYPVQAASLTTQRLHARLSPPIRIHERLKPVAVLHTKRGETVLDMGQNMVGWMEFRVNAPAGTEIKLIHGEVLQDDCFYRENMRTALCEYTYIANGAPDLARAHFTFYGFRYVKVEGWHSEVCADDFTGCVIHSAMEETARLTTDNALLNRLIENVRWGQKGNFLDVPTDCPQRDERMGWTGDAQIFADTACYNMDTYAFYTKFGKDLACEQEKCGGSVPYVVPMSRYELHGATVWGDAATVIPWQVYQHFGDPAILRAQYESMCGWVEYMHREDERTGAKRLWTTGRHFGDWLALDGKVDGGVYGSTEKEYIATAYYFYSCDILAKTARVLCKDSDAARYEVLAKEIKAAFQAEYFTKTGRLAIDTQTAYALALSLHLVPEHAMGRIGAAFKQKLKENNFKLNTGFVGTPCLCAALTECGQEALAWDLLMNEDYPGWLYEVKLGATTIWERWNSVLPDGSISGTGMNSLNHYAYGSVLAWVYRYVIGLAPVEHAPGFREATIAPRPSYQLGKADCTLQTPAGQYHVGWQLADSRFTLQVAIPFGARAKVTLPHAAGQTVEGIPAGAQLVTEGESISLWLDSGAYTFVYTTNRPLCKRYSMDSNLNELMANPATAEIILRHFPRAARGIPFQNEGTIVEEIAKSPFAEVTDEALAALRQELEAWGTNA